MSLSNRYLRQFQDSLDRAMYHELVMRHLEYIGFPEYAVNMPAPLLSHFIVETSDICRARELSPRFASLMIFGHSFGVMTRIFGSELVTKH